MTFSHNEEYLNYICIWSDDKSYFSQSIESKDLKKIFFWTFPFQSRMKPFLLIGKVLSAHTMSWKNVYELCHSIFSNAVSLTGLKMSDFFEEYISRGKLLPALDMDVFVTFMCHTWNHSSFVGLDKIFRCIFRQEKYTLPITPMWLQSRETPIQTQQTSLLSMKSSLSLTALACFIRPRQ